MVWNEGSLTVLWRMHQVAERSRPVHKNCNGNVDFAMLRVSSRSYTMLSSQSSLLYSMLSYKSQFSPFAFKTQHCLCPGLRRISHHFVLLVGSIKRDPVRVGRMRATSSSKPRWPIIESSLLSVALDSLILRILLFIGVRYACGVHTGHS